MTAGARLTPLERTYALVLALLALSSVGGAQEPSRRYAVIIDAGSAPLYREEFRAFLKLPESPTGSLVDAFTGKGYDVTWLGGKGLSRAETLGQLYQLTATLDERDSLVVYCGGYAVRRSPSQGGSYWLQDSGRLAELETNGVRLDEIFEVFRQVRATKKLLLLDFLFLGDVVYAIEKGAKMQIQRQMRTYPEASLERGDLPLLEVTALGERGPSHLAAAVSPEAASRLERRGILGAAVRDALSGAADVDRDGSLQATEMFRFVQNELERRAGEARLIVEGRLVETEIQLAARIEENWVLADVPAGNAVARARRDRYLATLREWRDRNWISVSTELASRSVLDEWIRSLEEGPALSPKYEELWEILQKHMEGTANEVDRARSLEAQTRKRY